MSPITRSSEYAIRALTYLAQQAGDAGYVQARELAERLGIPAPFLGKLLQPLAARGILESQRGPRGGFRLSAEARSIALYEIIATTEDLEDIRTCFLGQSECSDERACPMHVYWKEARAAFEEKLGTTTLSDLTRFCVESPDSGYPLPEPVRRHKHKKRRA